MELNYDFNHLLKLPDTSPPPKDNREGIKIVKCCGNCKFCWFAHANERRGFCRIGQMDKKAPNRDKPHNDWAHMHVHSTMVCDKHVFRAKGYWKNWVEGWVDKTFDTNGDLVEE